MGILMLSFFVLLTYFLDDTRAGDLNSMFFRLTKFSDDVKRNLFTSLDARLRCSSW